MTVLTEDGSIIIVAIANDSGDSGSASKSSSRSNRLKTKNTLAEALLSWISFARQRIRRELKLGSEVRFDPAVVARDDVGDAVIWWWWWWWWLLQEPGVSCFSRLIATIPTTSNNIYY